MQDEKLTGNASFTQYYESVSKSRQSRGKSVLCLMNNAVMFSSMASNIRCHAVCRKKIAMKDGRRIWLAAIRWLEDHNERRMTQFTRVVLTITLNLSQILLLACCFAGVSLRIIEVVTEQIWSVNVTPLQQTNIVRSELYSSLLSVFCFVLLECWILAVSGS